MKRAAGVEQVVMDEESANDEPPAEKISKKDEELDPSVEVLELRKKVAKVEHDYQNACRIAGEAQARVAFLEDLLDKKPVIVDGGAERRIVDDLQKTLAEASTHLNKIRNVDNSDKKQVEDLQKEVKSLTEQLELEKSRATEERMRLGARIDDLTRKYNQEVQQGRAVYTKNREKIDELERQLSEKPHVLDDGVMSEFVAELEMRLACLTQQLDAERSRANEDRKRLNSRREDLTFYREKELSRANDDRKRDQAKIEKLTRQLAQAEKKPQPYNELQPSTATVKKIPAFTPMPEKPPREKEKGHPTNIFEKCSYYTETIAHSDAAERLGALYEVIRKNEEWRERSVTALADEILDCDMCRKELTAGSIITHFLSKDHAKKARKSDVSLAAFEYWMRKLEAIQQPVTAHFAEWKMNALLKELEAEIKEETTKETPKETRKETPEVEILEDGEIVE